MRISVGDVPMWLNIACNVETSPPAGSCGVLVLGYPSESNGSPNDVQKMRVATGVRAYRSNNCDQIVFSGAIEEFAQKPEFFKKVGFLNTANTVCAIGNIKC
jgi:hypothetical protein